MMMKFAMLTTVALTLSACIDGGNAASVARLDTLSSNCGSLHMQTINNLPMRCGPQVADPYTYQ